MSWERLPCISRIFTTGQTASLYLLVMRQIGKYLMNRVREMFHSIESSTSRPTSRLRMLGAPQICWDVEQTHLDWPVLTSIPNHPRQTGRRLAPLRWTHLEPVFKVWVPLLRYVAFSDAWVKAGTLNRRHTFDTSSGSNAHPETSYSQTNVTRSSLWTSNQLGALSPGVSDTPISSTVSYLQSETPTIGDSSRTADGALRKAIVPSKGGSLPPQTATLPTADVSSSHDEMYTTQERQTVEVGATIDRAELAPQGSFQRMRVFESLLSTGTPTPASHVSFSAPMSPGQEASPAAATPASKPLDGSLLSLLGTNQSYSSDTRDQHPTDLVYGGLIPPKLPPPEPYEFREMTLGCRFGTSIELYTTIIIILTNASPPL